MQRYAKIELKSDLSKVAFGNFKSLNRNQCGQMQQNFLLHDTTFTRSIVSSRRKSIKDGHGKA